ncbi:Hsp70 family protein [Marinomonas mediterranea]|uniref:Hsp70 family protein n=1 Tax=Marinomonas mediterranea TaxID=119864 RepID=UPI0023499C75|nr:Hsp70 family protein [Marinomonas mediterranea]WCN09307.1 Hsp70 family protein [Marinomonas mediterranea]
MSKTYRVGIDLGTTNCVVSYFDPDSTNSELNLLTIPQNMGDGAVQEFTSLPSAIYLLAEDERTKIKPVLPWHSDKSDFIVGQGALELGQRRVGQLVQSAKSWLSHQGVNRRDAILPWGSEAKRKISPLKASEVLLRHIKEAWNHQFPESKLENQQVTLTLPASFDEEARSLTLEAARNAGIRDLYLLEEPQAACYYFIRNEAQLASLKASKMLLVVDIGGGTSDFSLVHIQSTETGRLALKRIAVGSHLLLGGDNLDQALAYQLDPRQISALSASRLAALTQQTRKAKETLLSDSSARSDGGAHLEVQESVTLTVLGAGSKLIGGSQKFVVERQKLLTQIEQGFVPLVDKTEKVEKAGYAIHALGLPYESDAAFTRHLAQFLSDHESEIESLTGEAMPDAVLFNGGFFNSRVIKDRFIAQLNQWAEKDIKVCDSSEPNDAVAKGAAHYLNALHGDAPRIESGVSHSLYLQMSDSSFVGLIPKGTPKEERVALKNEFVLKLGEQVQFPLYRSDDDLQCDVGRIVQDNSKMHFVSNLLSELQSNNEQDSATVQVSAKLSEVGVVQVQLKAVGSDQYWDLSFSTEPSESNAQDQGTETLHKNMGQAEELLVRCFSGAGQKAAPDLVKTLRNDLENQLGDRESWNIATSRRLSDKLLSLKSGRTKSAQHERIWLQMTGFCLRPGYGYAGDEERVTQVVNLTKNGAKYDTSAVWAQYWTLFRRVAGGLSIDQQAVLYKQFSQFYSPSGQKSRDKQKQLQTRSGDDLIRLVGALERLSNETKIETMDWLTKRLKKSSESDTSWWAIGRMASRQLLIQENDFLLAEDIAAAKIELALKEDWKKRKQAGLAAILMSQMTEVESDKLSVLRKKIAVKLKKDKCPALWLERLNETQSIDEASLSKLVGETLPIGLSLI